MRKSTIRPKAPSGGWWNLSGWQACEVCGARYDFEVEVRCADCDAAVCPLCAIEVTSRRTLVCAACVEEDG